MEKTGFFARLKEGLSRTRENFARLGDLMWGRPTFDQDFYDELEEILLQADVASRRRRRFLSNSRSEFGKDRWRTRATLDGL
jgi:fused signal recognition particle receptor